jgi:hypothetical protein
MVIEFGRTNRWSLRSEPVFQDLHFLLQFSVAVFGRCQSGTKALRCDPVLRAGMLIGPLAAGGLVDEGGEVFVAL